MKAILTSLIILSLLCFSFKNTEMRKVVISGQAVDYKTGKPIANIDLIIQSNAHPEDFAYDLYQKIASCDSNGNFTFNLELNLSEPSYTIMSNDYASIEFIQPIISDSIKLSKIPMVSYDSEYVVISQDPGADCTPIDGNHHGDPIPQVLDYLKSHHSSLIPNPVDTMKMGHSALGSDAKCMYQFKVLSFKCLL